MSEGVGSPRTLRAPREVRDGRVAARVLGAFEIVAGGHPITRADWQRLSAERLVKLLLVTRGHRLTREAAAETLWPDAAPQASRANLRKALHFATHAFDGTDFVVADDEAIALPSDRLDLDLDRLRAALDLLATADPPGPTGAPGGRANGGSGLHSDPDALAAAADAVIELGSEELLPDDLYEDWLVGPRERLRARWLQLALQAARREADEGRRARAHEIVGRVLERDPTDEAAHRLAIDLYAAEGRHHAARRQYAMCRQALRSGLDVDPSPETEEAFARAEHAAGATGAEGEPGPSARLVARHGELQRIEPLLDRVAGGRLATLAIHGPSGIGKTRLLQEVVTWARAGGWGVIEWQAVESSRSLTFAPFRVGLVRLVDPDEVRRWAEPARSALTALAPGVGRGSLRFAARPALVTALVAAIERVSEDRPLIVAIDDVPWLDGPSREVLHAVASGLPDRPILLAVTIRDDEPHPDETAHPTVEVRPGEGLELALGPLAQRDVERLIVEHLGGDAVSAEVLRLAHDQGAGNPLFCLELVRHWREAGRVRMEGGRWVATAGVPDAGLPVTIRRLVERRAATLPANAREILAVAARMGPELGFTELAAATSIPQESLVEAIDTAIASGLLVEQGAGYAFAHPLYRVAFDAPVGTARTGGMRLRIARALARVEAGAPPDALIRAAAAMVDPRPVAEHALAAAELGEIDARTLAVAFGFAAGDRARGLFDGAGAVELLERSLAVWRRLPADVGVAFPASAACVSLIDLNTHVAGGADAAAARAFREAVGTARDAGELASAYAARFWLPYRHGDFQGAIGVLEEGLRALPPEAVAARARLRSNVGWCLYRLRRLDDALPVLDDAVATLEASPDRRGAMQALDFLGVLLRSTDRHEEGIGCLERSLRLAYELGDSRGELLAEIHLTSAFTRIGRASLARPHRDRAIPLARQIGDRYAEAVATWTAADLEDLAGDLPAAAALRREELRLLAAIGGNAHNEALAHAHLANLAWRSGDEAVFRAGSDIAVGLAERSDDPTYPARIRRALQAPDWWRLET